MGNVRDQTLDIAKGIAIIAIVAGHVWRGLAEIDLIVPTSELFISVDRTLYMFHLAVFAFAAGLFIERGMTKAGPWQYAYRRDLEFLWLYLIWMTLQIGSKVLMGGAVNSPVSPATLLTPWYPKEQFWFFGWIGLMMILAASAQPWRSRLRMGVTWVVAAALSLATWGIGWSLLGTQGLGLTGFFVAGVVLTGPRVIAFIRAMGELRCAAIALTSGAALVLLSVFTNATAPTDGGESRTVLTVALGGVAATAGVVSVLGLSALLARLPVISTTLAYIGRLSLAIFVAHVFFTAATRMMLTKLGLDSLAVHQISATVVGTAAPLVMFELCRRLKLGWLFEAPQWLTASGQSTDVVLAASGRTVTVGHRRKGA